MLVKIHFKKWKIGFHVFFLFGFFGSLFIVELIETIRRELKRKSIGRGFQLSIGCNSNHLFAAIDFDDPVLIDVFENVGSIHEDANGAGCGHDEEDVELQSVNDHGHVFPILAGLKGGRERRLVPIR